MDEYSLRLAKPHCSECHRPKGVVVSLEEEPQELISPFFPENRAIKQGEIPGELSLFQRLQKTIQSATSQEQDEEI